MENLALNPNRLTQTRNHPILISTDSRSKYLSIKNSNLNYKKININNNTGWIIEDIEDDKITLIIEYWIIKYLSIGLYFFGLIILLCIIYFIYSNRTA